MLKLEVGCGEVLTQRILDYVVALIGAQSVQEVERQARGILHEMPFAIHIDVMMRSWVGFFRQATQTRGDDSGLQKVSDSRRHQQV